MMALLPWLLNELFGLSALKEVFWNELECKPFSAYVQLEFPAAIDAQRWASSPEYLALVPIRNQAMQLSLFSMLPSA